MRINEGVPCRSVTITTSWGMHIFLVSLLTEDFLAEFEIEQGVKKQTNREIKKTVRKMRRKNIQPCLRIVYTEIISHK